MGKNQVVLHGPDGADFRFRDDIDLVIVDLMDCPGPGRPYNRPALVRLTFEYARSLESQDKFLVFFFRSVAVGMLDGDLDDPTCTGLRNLVFEVAQFLMTNFFLPCRFCSLLLLVSA